MANDRESTPQDDVQLPRPAAESSTDASDSQDPFAAAVSEDEAKPLAPRYLRDNAGFKFWLQAVNNFYQARRIRYDALSSINAAEKAQFKARMRRVFLTASAFENTRGISAAIVFLGATVLVALIALGLAGSVVIESYSVTSGSGVVRAAAAFCSVPAAVLLLATLLYVSLATPTLVRVGSLQPFIISIILYFALTRYSNYLTACASAALLSLLVPSILFILVPFIRMGIKKWFVRYPFIFFTITIGVSLWLRAYPAVMVSVAYALVASTGLILIVGSMTTFFWSLNERKAHKKYPAEFITDKLCQALATCEQLDASEVTDAAKVVPRAPSMRVSSKSPMRKQIVTNLKDVALLLTGPLTQSLSVSEPKTDADLLSQFKACAASVRAVAVAVAVRNGFDSPLSSVRRLFVSSVDEKWGDFRELGSLPESSALEKRVAVGQILLHLFVALFAFGGVYFLEVIKPGWLPDEFRNAAAVPLVFLALQQLVSIFDQSVAANGLNILRGGAEILTKNR